MSFLNLVFTKKEEEEEEEKETKRKKMMNSSLAVSNGTLDGGMVSSSEFPNKLSHYSLSSVNL